MLQFGSDTLTVDGVTVFRDHANPRQFWYLPAPVDIARRQPDNRAAFTLISWKPADAAGGTKGGGFLTLESTLRLPRATEQKILAAVRALVPSGEPILTATPFDSGTVRCVALDLEGGGGTRAQDPPGTFRAVEAISGATTPSMAGDNTAAFSLTLTQEGATILKQAFEQGTTPVGVIYDLKYTGLRPSLQIKITADYEKIFQHFSAGLEAQVYWFRAGIDAGFESLVANGAITIEVINFSNAADRETKEKWALDFFKQDLLAKWFEPTLTPADIESRMAKPEALDAVMTRLKSMQPDAKAVEKPDDKKTPEDKKPTEDKTGKPAEDKKPEAAVTPAAQPAPQRQKAALKIVSRTPDGAPAERTATLTPSESGNEELVALGDAANAKAKVDGQDVALRDGKVVLDVPAGQTRKIEIRWPGKAATTKTETFRLFFTYPRPLDPALAGRGTWNRQHPDCKAYAAGTMTPRDDRLMDASGVQGQAPTGNGPQALRDWLKRLASPAIVKVEGHASYEGHPEKAKDNQALSSRRVDVALEIIGSAATVPPSDLKALGQTRAQNATPPRVSHPDGTGPDFPDDRVVEITGTVRGEDGVDETVLVAEVSRPADVQPPKKDEPKKDEPKKDEPKKEDPPKNDTPPKKEDPKPASTPAASPSGTPALVSLRLKYIRQEERKKMTLSYNRTEAVQASYAPQGFLGLLLRDLADPSKHFVEVDLDDPFFRRFEVVVDAPIDYARIGLLSAQVSIDYGDPDDPASLKHKDFVFDRASPTRNAFTTFMSPDLASGYRYSVQYQFDPNAGWDGEKLSYEIPPVDTTDRTQTVLPQNMLGFLEISVLPNRMDAAMVDFTEVMLAYDDPSGWKARRTVIVRPGGEAQTWRLRSSDRHASEYSYTMRHHLKNGRVVESPAVTTTASAVSVDDPFEDALDIQLVPLWRADAMRNVFVDVSYADPANAYRRNERIVFEGADTAPRGVRIALLDPARRSFDVQIAMVGADNALTRRTLTTTDTIVGVGP
ncbi:hypothetical protein NK718_03885 [Alsobacter sp. SYSU M60028]|uniref:OmpA-like domain-containing protein n=1 Tax=Alsobacter ponti TaxID=2962936 RepID=A0ABT1L859_9HYPH|nr:hypothetical protein [Alsobacter ponti]MCP8937642.1 hypothetical protein [Alsobacter ponti]